MVCIGFAFVHRNHLLTMYDLGSERIFEYLLFRARHGRIGQPLLIKFN